ncbi:hypothetical protein RIF29_40847 [Crotalaria pallida]|uniref:HMA domain-containing protein n=1 Tax=Crotalaria pallida TaxID=3830 RepID=A0AAN9E4F6_CROPI
MGEGNKVDGKKEETTEEKKEEETPETVLKVDMHCQACARKIAKALKGFEGVEEVTADSKASKVVVKGKADPIKVCERLQKKSGKKVELISPLPKPPEEKKEEIKEEPKPEEKKEEVAPPPPVVTVVLKVNMHCEACAQVIQKRIRKIQATLKPLQCSPQNIVKGNVVDLQDFHIKRGVESVETDFGNDRVTVKGVIDPSKLVDYLHKRTKKQVSIVKEEEEKNKEEKKEEEETKKEEKEEEKQKEGEENKGEEDDIKTDIKRNEYWPSRNYVDYAYAPHIFSDENPNACFVM